LEVCFIEPQSAQRILQTALHRVLEGVVVLQDAEVDHRLTLRLIREKSRAANCEPAPSDIVQPLALRQSRENAGEETTFYPRPPREPSPNESRLVPLMPNAIE
jgi:hypothetical protein